MESAIGKKRSGILAKELVEFAMEDEKKKEEERKEEEQYS